MLLCLLVCGRAKALAADGAWPGQSASKLHDSGDKASSGVSGLRQLVSHLPANHTTAIRHHRLDIDHMLQLTVVLDIVNSSALDALLATLYEPSSPHYGKYLTPADFAAAFHPAPETVAALREALTARGFVLEAQPHGLMWSAHAPSRVVESTLGIEMHVFEATNGRRYHAPVGTIHIPQAWPLQAMLGLFESPPRQPHYHVATAQPQVDVTTGIRTAYGVPSTATGTGQTLALLELDGYLPSDIAAYAQARNIPLVPLKNILVNGFSGVVQDANAQGEVTLDIELMNAMAPMAAQIRVYEAANTASAFVAIINEMANPTLGDKRLPTLISCSWGSPESSEAPATLQAENVLFMQMAAQGQSFFVASGDSGADADGSTLSVDDPASQPWVIGVGGTTLHTKADGTYQSESAWAGGGGGISAVWPIPAWQKPAVAAGSGGSTTMRNVPDVAFNADPATGYTIILNGTTLSGVGGTSCAAPLWTAYMGLVNAQRAQRGIAPVGFVNPLLYNTNRISRVYNADFHDIADHTTNGHYAAVTGLDQATGWGSFVGTNLLTTLSSGYARRPFFKPAWF